MSTKNNLKPPIILFGNTRSGTTMFHRIFKLHEDVESWFEPRTIWMYGDPSRKNDQFTEVDATDKVKRYIRKRFLKYQQKHGNRRVMEKTPSNVLRVPYVNAIFPESKFLYIIREPLANLSSAEIRWQYRSNWHRLWERFLECPKSQVPHYFGRFIIDRYKHYIKRSKYFSMWGIRYPEIYEDLKTLTVEEIIAKQWVAGSVQAGKDILEIDPSRVMSIRYEDFVSNPVEMYRSIGDYFNLTVTYTIEKQLSEMVDSGRHKKWKRLNKDILKRCFPILENEMKRHGYDTSEIDEILSA